ncbi:MAG: GntR family transcriptional regulator [Desulfobacteraceae bacterium]|nr:GntR family transcriptional regulator [Desulfobacteraceae bacterium]
MKSTQLLRPAQHTEYQLLTSILNGTHPPGSALPNERSLAMHLGITRPTLREALQRMAREGWITIQHGKATMVNDYALDGGMGMLTTLSAHPEFLPAAYILHFLEVRLVLLPEVAGMAAEKAPETLLRHLSRHEQLNDDKESFAEFDWQLQLLMATHSGNPIFRLIVNDFSQLFKTMAPAYFAMDDARRASTGYYQALSRFITGNDREKVVAIVRSAMRDAMVRWKQMK